MTSSLSLPRTAAFVASLLVLLAQPSPAQAAVPTKVSHVVHIVADGLRSSALLPPSATGTASTSSTTGGTTTTNTANHPAFDYLLQTGSCTLNARPDDLSSQTLPNHISMFTGLPISVHGYREDKDHGGNSTLVDTTATTTGGDGNGDKEPKPFTSIFDLVSTSRASSQTNGRAALFTSKTKFELFARTFPLTTYYQNKKSKAVVRRFLNELENKHFAYSYLHIVDPDLNGHRYDGAASVQYSQGVELASYRLGQVLDVITAHPELKDDTAIILTADHGFSSHGNHANGDDREVYTMPFCVWGPGVKPGGDLYDLNKDNGSGVVDPGLSKGRGQKVVRNTYAGVMAADFLGLGRDEEGSGGGVFADQYLSVSDGTTAQAMTWEEWKTAKADDYDWSEPTNEEEEMEEVVVVDSTDEEEGSNDTTATAAPPEIVIPVEEVSKEDIDDGIDDEEEEPPAPIDVEEPTVITEEVPVPIDIDEEINTQELPVPIDAETEVEEVKEEEEDEASTVLIPPSPPSEEVSKANSLPEDNETIDTSPPDDASTDTLDEESTDTLVQEQEALWEKLSESQDAEDEGGAGPDISAFIEETTPESNEPSQTSGLNGIKIGLIAASAVAILALVAAVYIYATTHKGRSHQANAEPHEDDLEKAGGCSNNKLNETRVSISSGGSDDGTANLFSGYTSSSTFDEESCIDVGGAGVAAGGGRSFNRSSSAVSNRSYSLNEVADAHLKAVEAGAWPDDEVPLESVEVEAVEVTVTETKTIWHVVDLQK